MTRPHIFFLLAFLLAASLPAEANIPNGPNNEVETWIYDQLGNRTSHIVGERLCIECGQQGRRT